METKFNFNSQVATNRQQSERLLALGLKKETADMYYEMIAEGELPRIMPHTSEIDYFQLWDSITPAWSLHRLMELYLNSTDTRHEIRFNQEGIKKAYEYLVVHIEWLIKEGYFNKEYLVDQEAIEEHCKGVQEYLDYIREED